MLKNTGGWCIVVAILICTGTIFAGVLLGSAVAAFEKTTVVKALKGN